MWQGLAQAVGKTIVLITTVLLARLLSPEQYGLVALALVLMAYADAIADGGVAQALVYLPRRAGTSRAALLISVLTGCALVVTTTLAAPAIGAFFHRPDVAPLVRILAVSLFASSLGAVPEALMRREFQFQRLTLATVIRAFVTGGVTIGLALAGQGAWSLVWGTLAGTACYALAGWILLPEQAHLQFWRVDRAELRTIFNYGFPVAGSALLAKLIFDIDYLIVGALLGAEALGYYTLAFRLPELVIINVFFVLSTVTFPLYSRARDDPERLRRGYLKSVQVQSLYGVCAGVGLAVVAPYVVPVVFGPAWIPAVVPLVLLSLYAAARSLGTGANEIYKATGRPGLSVRLSLVRLAILVPALLVAARWGILGIAWAQLIVAIVFSVGMQTFAARVIGLRWRELARAIEPAVLCGAAVAVVGGGLLMLGLSPILALVIIVLAGLAVVAAVLAVAYPEVARVLVALGRS